MEAQLDRALEIALAFSGFSNFAESYPPLFKRLWRKHAGEDAGTIALTAVRPFCDDMVAAGWKDWDVSPADLAKLEGFAGSGVPLLAFAEWSENPSFNPDDVRFQAATAARITPSHEEWKAQGGANPSAPTSGPAEGISTVDWSLPRDEVVAAVAKALKNDGFFILVNHGVRSESISGMLHTSKEFFARLKVAEQEAMMEILREEAMRPQMKCARGYTPIREEALNPVQGPDLKESFDYALAPAPSMKTPSKSLQPSRRSSPPPRTGAAQHLGDNLWPKEEGAAVEEKLLRQGPPSSKGLTKVIAPPQFRQLCESYLQEVHKLSEELLRIILEGAGIDETTMKEQVLPMFEEPLVISRLLRYPSTAASSASSPVQFGSTCRPLHPPPRSRNAPSSGQEMGAGSHVDYGALTLIAEDSAGLEVQRRNIKGAPWESVRHVEGSFIVNTGFMLEKLTNGFYPATRHRVQNKNYSDRHALALFLDPHPDSKVGPLPNFVSKTVPAKYEPCVAGHKGVRFGDSATLNKIADSCGVSRGY